MKKRVVICAIITLLIEVFVFNLSTVLSIGNQKEIVTETYSIEGATLNPESGVYTIDSEQVILYAGGIKKDVSDIYIGVDFQDEIVPYSMRITDEGNTYTAYETSTQYILQWSESSKYIRIHPYGKVLTNKIVFTVSPGKTMRINEIAYNPSRPLRIRPFRLIVVFMLQVGFILFSEKSKMHELQYSNRPGKRKQIIRILSTLAFVTIGVLGICILTLKCGGYWSTYAYITEYDDLAVSLSEGHYYLDYDVSEELKRAENPYDYTYRDVNQVKSYWDTAYYNGKYFCYFGVTPVLLLYLPYYLVTGMNLNNVVAALIFAIMIWLSVIWFMHECILSFFPEAPLWFWFVGSVFLGYNVQLVYLYQRPDMYDIPILAGNALLFAGLSCWLHSLRSKRKRLFMVLGSTCIALLAGCRPQMVLVAFLAIPIFNNLLIEKSDSRFNNWKNYGIAILLPFVVFAIFIMQYNYARFGSVFDFGANYNLTTNDMTKRGFHIDRLGSGMFSFLFQLPSMLSIYPFMIRSNVATEYMGKTIAENVYGGVITTNLICLALGFFGYVKNRLNKQSATLIVVMCASIGGLLCCVDATVAGVLQRYMGDFVSFFVIPSILIVGIILSEFWKQRRQLYYILAMLCWVLLLFVGIMDFSVVCVQLRDGGADVTTEILYHELRSYFVLQ